MYCIELFATGCMALVCLPEYYFPTVLAGRSDASEARILGILLLL
jgi:hypothetical protein